MFARSAHQDCDDFEKLAVRAAENQRTQACLGITGQPLMPYSAVLEQEMDGYD